MINERLPAFLKPIPSNSTKATTSTYLSDGPVSVDDMAITQQTKELHKMQERRRKRGSRLLLIAGSLCARLARPFRKGRREPPSVSTSSTSTAVVDMDECSPWA
jgi:hypothetical protein